ncbi:MAG: hypothetical protein ACRDHL_05480 [Candidatus Promineifilaceae bacterium]
MAAASPSSQRIKADQEHPGLRAAVFALMVVGSLGGFAVLWGVIRRLPEGTFLREFGLALSCLLAFPVGVAAAGLGELILKRLWPSGRGLNLDESGLEAQLPNGEGVRIQWSKRINPTCWYFSLRGFPRGGRERQVPASYTCLACQLQQDGRRLVVYTLAPERQAAAYTQRGDFVRLRPGQLYDSNMVRRFMIAPARPELPTSLLAGKDGPYWLAERRRWLEGLELKPEDFDNLMARLDAQLEDQG